MAASYTESPVRRVVITGMGYRGVRAGDRYYSEPYMAQDYYLQPYVRSEIVFQDGIVKEWRTLPSPK